MVAAEGGASRCKAEAVAGISEFFEYDGASRALEHGVCLVDVCHALGAGIAHLFRHRVGFAFRYGLALVGILLETSEPSPVVGPDVDAGIVDAGQGVDGAEELHVLFAAVASLGTGSDEVVGVDGPYEARLAVNPFHELAFVQFVAVEGAGFVGNLPRHECGALAVGYSGVAVLSRNDEAGMSVGHCLRPFVEDEVRHMLCIFAVSVNTRNGCLAEMPCASIAFRIVRNVAFEAHPVEVCPVSSRPFPGVVEVEDGPHVAFLEFEHQIVESGKEGVVVYPRFGLQFWCDVRGYAVTSVTSDEHAHVVHADGFQMVEFAVQTFAVAAPSLTAQDGAIPEVGTHIAVFLVAEVEMSVAYGDEGLGGVCGGLCGCFHGGTR